TGIRFHNRARMSAKPEPEFARGSRGPRREELLSRCRKDSPRTDPQALLVTAASRPILEHRTVADGERGRRGLERLQGHGASDRGLLHLTPHARRANWSTIGAVHGGGQVQSHLGTWLH